MYKRQVLLLIAVMALVQSAAAQHKVVHSMDFAGKANIWSASHVQAFIVSATDSLTSGKIFASTQISAPSGTLDNFWATDSILTNATITAGVITDATIDSLTYQDRWIEFDFMSHNETIPNASLDDPLDFMTHDETIPNASLDDPLDFVGHDEIIQSASFAGGLDYVAHSEIIPDASLASGFDFVAHSETIQNASLPVSVERSQFVASGGVETVTGHATGAVAFDDTLTVSGETNLNSVAFISGIATVTGTLKTRYSTGAGIEIDPVNNTIIYRSSGGTAKYQLRYYPDYFYIFRNSVTGLVIDSAGEVVVGTTTDYGAYPFQVVNTNNMIATGYSTHSRAFADDGRRIKKDITDEDGNPVTKLIKQDKLVLRHWKLDPEFYKPLPKNFSDDKEYAEAAKRWTELINSPAFQRDRLTPIVEEAPDKYVDFDGHGLDMNKITWDQEKRIQALEATVKALEARLEAAGF